MTQSRSPRPRQSLPPDYFESRYQANADPWDFATSAYERAKYAASLTTLSQPSYANALEIGCSIGVFTRLLALRCGALTAMDISSTALRRCQKRCADLPQVKTRQGAVPQDWPAGRYDLLVFSEILYYLNHADLGATAMHARRALVPGGEILLVHWLGETDYPLTGDEAAELFIEHLADRCVHVVQDRTDRYRLDLLRGPR